MKGIIYHPLISKRAPLLFNHVFFLKCQGKGPRSVTQTPRLLLLPLGGCRALGASALLLFPGGSVTQPVQMSPFVCLRTVVHI